MSQFLLAPPLLRCGQASSVSPKNRTDVGVLVSNVCLTEGVLSISARPIVIQTFPTPIPEGYS